MHPATGTRQLRGVSLSLAVLLALVAAVGPVLAAQDPEIDLDTTEGRGRACTHWFYSGELAKIEALGFTDAMAAALPSMGGLAGFWETVDTQLGAEVEFVEEAVSKQQGLDVYVRTAKFEKYPGDVIVQWVFDAEGAIAGMAIRPKQ